MSNESQELKKVGLKVTLPRMRILEMLETAEARHMSAEEVYKRLLESGEELGLATVYRVLTQFEGAGLVQRHHFESGHAVFELAGEGHHDHMVCRDCGRVEEFYDRVIEERQEAMATERGFRIADHSLIIHVDCERRDCPHRGG